MNAAPLILELQEAGIRVSASASGDRLHVEAPAGTVTPQLRQRIAENKPVLLAALRQPVITTTTDTRAALLALAERYGFDLAHVHRLHDLDVAACTSLDDARFVTYLALLDDTATRWEGGVPFGHTAAIQCHHCGPVYVHPSIAACLPVVAGWPRALGCPWCAIRKAGGCVPRPRITCENCMRFQPDSINPATGMGQCSSGHGMHYPVQKHACGDFRPA